MSLKVLVVDDTILFRRIITEALADVPGVEVVGTAANGKVALDRIASLKPDLLTLDIEMPGMNGLEVLKALQRRNPEIGVIMLSARTVKGGDLTIKALELGAFDFVTKPARETVDENRELIKGMLIPIVKAFAGRREIRKILRGKIPEAGEAPKPEPRKVCLDHFQKRMCRLTRTFHPEMVLIGVSTGGPNALNQMLPWLPADLDMPVLIVQHMPPIFTASLAASLDAKCAIRVKEAEDGETAEPNRAYIAPGGRQMRILPGPLGEKVIRITDDPPENNCKPSVDCLFRSAARHFAGRSLAVIMTGMGNDGMQGLKLLKAGGGLAIAQDEASCVIFGMPREAIQAGIIDAVVPLDGMASEIVRFARGAGA